MSHCMAHYCFPTCALLMQCVHARASCALMVQIGFTDMDIVNRMTEVGGSSLYCENRLTTVERKKNCPGGVKDNRQRGEVRPETKSKHNARLGSIIIHMIIRNKVTRVIKYS